MDGESEFQDIFKEVVEAWGAVLHKSSANHPQSHGAVERYNRTLENRMAKMLMDHEEATWWDIRPAAVEVIINSVQGSISDNGAAVAPAELWFARQPMLQSVPAASHRMPRGTAQYILMLKKTREQVKEYVNESTRLYHKGMESRKAGTGRGGARLVGGD